MFTPKKEKGYLEPDKTAAIARIAAARTGRDGKHRAGYKPIRLYDTGGEVTPEVTEAQRLAITPLGKQASPKQGAESSRLQITPLISTKVYDDGGEVDVNDGRHVPAILEAGERVLTPEQNDQVENEHPELIATNEAPVQLKPLGEKSTASPEKVKAADIVSNPGARTTTSDVDTLIPERDTTKDQERPTKGGVLADQFLKHIGVDQVTVPKEFQRPTSGMPQIGTPASAVVPDDVLSKIPGTPQFKAARSSAMPTIDLTGKTAEAAPLIPATSATEPTGKDAFKAQIAKYDNAYQAAMDKAAETNDPQYKEQAARIQEAKLAYEKQHPWGSKESAHPGFLGKIGHVAEQVLSRAPITAGVAATIPGSEGYRAAQGNAAQEQVKEANAENVAENKPAKEGTAEQQYIQAATALRTAQASGDQDKITAAQNRLNDIHDAIVAGKSGKETREDHLSQYAGLKNKAASGEQLSGPEQTTYNTLKTELTVPPTVRTSYNKQIDHMLDAADVKDTETRNAYHIPEDATSEEAAKFLSDAKATYGENAPERLQKAADAKETAKQKSNMGYVELEDGSTLMASQYDQLQGSMQDGPYKGAKIIGNFEAAKSGDFSKDRQAVRVLNDVQKNVSAYDKALKEDMPAVQKNPDDLAKIQDVVALNEQTGGAAISLGANGVSISSVSPTIAAQIKAGALEEARKDLKSMSPAARRVLTAYLRTATSVVAYQKAVTGSARANELQLNLELANIPAPYFDTETAASRLGAFQENVDIVANGYPKNLPGVHHPSELKKKYESESTAVPSAGNAKFHMAGAKGEIFSNDGTTWYDSKGEKVGK